MGKVTFKDVAHLYLGAKILLENKIKATIHGIEYGGNREYKVVAMLPNYQTVKVNEWDLVKPLLRKLDSITEEEAIQLAKLSEWEPHFRDVKVERNKFNYLIITWDGMAESREVFNATGEQFYCGEQFLWLLKNNFDLFNLIENDFALDINSKK